MEPHPGRDLDAVVADLTPPEAVDGEGLERSAKAFDEIARVLSDALGKAQE